MNANRMISMVIRMIMRRVMRRGMKAGMDRLGKGGGDTSGPDGRKTAQRARRTMRAGRKTGRF